MYVANTDQIRKADQIQIQEYYVPGILLMEQAGQKSAEYLMNLFPDQLSFLILAGPGNNGGDGLVIARYLHLAGKQVHIVLSHPGARYKGDALINYRILSGLNIQQYQANETSFTECISSFEQTPILVDALLGTGVQAALRSPISTLIEQVRAYTLNLIVVAIDLPSGLDADTGYVHNTIIEADYTLTFQLPKVCHYVNPAAQLCGKSIVIDIGIWPSIIEELKISRELITEELVHSYYIKRQKDSHKGTYGHVAVLGGSKNMPGAIAMTGYAALKAGAGLCTLICPEVCQQTILSRFPELMCAGVGSSRSAYFNPTHVEAVIPWLDGKDAIMIGPGLGRHVKTLAFLRALLPTIKQPLILDADGLSVLSAYPELWGKLPENTIITPHPGEMQGLITSQRAKTHRLESAEELAKERQLICVLKGSGTIVASPDGQTFINTTGNPGMASGGSGDVLTGIIGSLLAQGYSPKQAANMGVYLHGKAGDRVAAEVGQEGLTATMIADALRFPQN